MKEHRASLLGYHIDKCGRVVSKGSSPFSSSLVMTLDRGDLHARMSVTESPFSNGSAEIIISRNKSTVYKAEGCYCRDFFDWHEKTVKLSNDEWKEIMK